MAQWVKNQFAMQETQEMRVWSLGGEDPLEKEMTTHSSILAWKIPWMEEPGRLQLIELLRGGHDWTTLLTQSLRCFSGIALLFLWSNGCCNLISGSSQLVQFSSVTQSCPPLCDHMDCITPGLPVHHQLLELAQTHVHRVGDPIQPPHPLSLTSRPAFNLPQYQGLFHWVSSSHQVPKVLELHLQHQYFQWIFRTDVF